MKKILISLLFIIIILAGGFFYLFNKKGSRQTSTKYNDFSFICEADDVDKSDFDRIDGQFYLSLDFIKNKIDKDVFYDENEKVITFTNSKGTKRIPIDSDKAIFNNKEILLRDPAIIKNSKVYVPIEAFIYDYPLDLRYIEELKLLIMDYKNVKHPLGKLKGSGTNMREDASMQSPIVKNLKGDEEIIVFGEDKDWYKVRIKDGYAGYINKSLLEVDFNGEKFSSKVDLTKEAKRPLNLTWDYTYGPQSQISINNITYIPGVNTICPTWFSLKNGNGDLIDRGNIDYVTKYKNLGIDVWGYLDNSFDAEITNKALSSTKTREKIISGTMELLNKYGLKGLNIDFEHLTTKERDLLNQFLKEIYAICRVNKITLSVDVTPQISKDVNKEVYDRKVIANNCDYVMLMAYDQHWSSSDKAGSVAEYKWVEGNINNLLRQIPGDKFILCVPLYTRVWSIDKNNKVSSQSIGMKEVQNIISSKNLKSTFDDVAKQNYVEYEDGNLTKKIWIEDEYSLSHKASLINKYNLAGIASWRKGFETPYIWSVIKDSLNY